MSLGIADRDAYKRFAQRIDREVEAMPEWQRALAPSLRPDYISPSLETVEPESDCSNENASSE